MGKSCGPAAGLFPAQGEINMLNPVGTARVITMNHTYWLNKIKASLTPSTGCTEPAAIALNAATARANVKGDVKRIVAYDSVYALGKENALRTAH